LLSVKVEPVWAIFLTIFSFLVIDDNITKARENISNE